MKDNKPAKPFADFPLFAHDNGQWAKKHKGKLHYFGRWDDAEGSLARYKAFIAEQATANSTAEPKAEKPRIEKPNPNYPLTPHHGAKQWCKKINGKIHYFGPLADADAALDKYLREKDDLYAGRTPTSVGGLRLDDLLNRFRSSKKHLAETGEITERHFKELEAAGTLVVKAFSKSRIVETLKPDDFERLRKQITKGHSPHTLANIIQKVRSIFKYASDTDLIDRPVKFGPMFKKPTKLTMRRHRAAKGERMFTPIQIQKILAEAQVPLKAMILLGLNAGFANHDCGTLKRSVIDFDTGWVSYPRPKTGMSRRFPLWPETKKAIKVALASRPQPEDSGDDDLVFITKYGKPWFKGKAACPISAEFRKLIVKLKIHKQGLSFSTLRHVFETIGGKARDQIAVDRMMGHVSEHISAEYRERIEDEDTRLMRVAKVVRKWALSKTAPRREAAADDVNGRSAEAA
jgi:integrase